MARSPSKEFICSECSAHFTKWVGKCTNCGAWDSLSESSGAKTARAPAGRSSSNDAIRFSELPRVEEERAAVGIDEFDRVVGGGLVRGSLVLLGGEPGVGKSTILLQASQSLAENGHVVLYVTGEESAAQIRLRGDRLKVDSDNIFFLVENDLGNIIEQIESVKPEVVIIDSIQTVRSNSLDRNSGSISQVRESTNALVEFGKKNNVTCLITCHVTKEGVIAGPRAIEHLVDTVLYFEGESNYNHRIIRATKNRFGPTGELGIFEMRGEGLVPAPGASELFVNKNTYENPGSAIFPAREGTRTLLVEIQALVSHSGYATPRRTVVGLDYNRAVLVLAVLEKKLGIDLSGREVFISVTGGLSVNEPAVDLAVAAAVISSFRDKPVRKGSVIFGEVGLTGEVRGVSNLDERIREALSFGTKSVILPDSQKISDEWNEKPRLLRIDNVLELIDILF